MPATKSANFTISKRAISTNVKFSGTISGSKTYDGNTDGGTTSTSSGSTSGTKGIKIASAKITGFDGYHTGDVINITSADIVLGGKNYNTKTYSIKNIKIDNADYSIASTITANPTANATNSLITSKSLSLSGGGLTKGKIYDGSATIDISNVTNPTISSTGIAGETAKFTFTSAAYDVANFKPSGENYTVTLSGVSLTTNGDFNPDNYSINATHTFTVAASSGNGISKKDVIITGYSVQSKVYDGTNTATIIGAAVDTGIKDKTLTIKVTGTFEDQNAGTEKPVKITFELQNGTDLASNYHLTNATDNTLKGTINKKKITKTTTRYLSGTATGTKVYDATDAVDNEKIKVNDLKITSSDIIADEQTAGIGVTYTTAKLKDDFTVLNGKTLILSGLTSQNDNYEIEGDVTIEFTNLTSFVTPAPLKVTWEEQGDLWKAPDGDTHQIQYLAEHPTVARKTAIEGEPKDANLETAEIVFQVGFSGVPAGALSEAYAIRLERDVTCKHITVDEHVHEAKLTCSNSNFKIEEGTGVFKFKIVEREVTIHVNNLLGEEGKVYGETIEGLPQLKNNGNVTFEESDFAVEDGHNQSGYLELAVITAGANADYPEVGYYPLTVQFGSGHTDLAKNYAFTITGEFGTSSYTNSNVTDHANYAGKAGVFEITPAEIALNSVNISGHYNDDGDKIYIHHTYDHEREYSLEAQQNWFTLAGNVESVTITYGESRASVDSASAPEALKEIGEKTYYIKVVAENHKEAIYEIHYAVNNEGNIEVTFKPFEGKFANAKYGDAVPTEDDIWELITEIKGLHEQDAEVNDLAHAKELLKNIITLKLEDSLNRAIGEHPVAGSYKVGYDFKNGETAAHYVLRAKNSSNLNVYTVEVRELTAVDIAWDVVDNLTYGDTTHHTSAKLASGKDYIPEADIAHGGFTYDMFVAGRGESIGTDAHHTHDAGTYTLKITGFKENSYMSQRYKLPSDKEIFNQEITINPKQINVTITKTPASIVYGSMTVEQMNELLAADFSQWYTSTGYPTGTGVLSGDILTDIIFELEESGTYLEVGSHKLKISVKNNEYGNPNYQIMNSPEAYWQITKQLNEFETEFSIEDWHEGKTPSTPVSPKAKYENAEVTVEYFSDAACTQSVGSFDTSSPAGTYWAKVTIEDSANYSGISKTYSFMITPHRFEDVITEATCTAAGKIEHKCTVEGCGYSTEEEIEALGHAWGDWSETLPTCEDAGEKVRRCTRCEEGVERETIDALGHSWDDGRITQEPNCTEAGKMTKTCTRCAETEESEIEALGHNYVVDGEVSQAPTCDQPGIGSVVCTRCGDRQPQGEIPALGHSYDDGIITTPPTCEAAGVKTFTCSRCGDTYTEEVEQLEHEWKLSESRLPTCTEAGSETYYCTNCHQTHTRETEALGHDWVAYGEPAVAPTCTTEGMGARRCTRCGEIEEVGSEVIPALGHKLGEGKVKTPAGCTSVGIMEYTCERCGETVEEEIAALGHDFDEGTVETPATCEHVGKLVRRCRHDGCDETQEEEIAALGHAWGEGVVTVEPGCTSDGTETVRCTRCGAEIQQSVPATGHKWSVKKVTEPATCTQTGLGAAECEVCGATDEEYEIPALGHSFAEGKITQKPTCIEPGVKTYYCTRCEESYTEQVPALSHAFDEGKVTTPATCEKAGVKTYTCTRDNCGATVQEEIKPLGHDFVANGAVTKEPDCTHGGIGSVKCSRCGIERENGEIPALGHNWDEGLITKQPTCGSVGVKTYTCTRCGETQTETIPALSHEWDEGLISKAPTCTTTGEKTYTCRLCGAEKSEELAALGHSWDNGRVTTAATCETAGERTYTCTRCNETKTESIPATGHKWIADGTPTQAPTCTETGRGKVKCENCGATEEDGTIPALGHAWDNGVTTPATCEREGKITYTCTRGDCEETYEETIPALGHNWSDGTITKPAECGKTGEITYYCTRCNETRTEEIPALSHEWNKGVITTPANCTTDGTITYTCIHCNETYTESIPATGHKWIADGEPDEQPTCTEPGRGKVKCEVCGAEEADGEIPALGHSWNEGRITKQPSCTEMGTKEYTCTRDGCEETRTEEIPALGHSWGQGVVTKAPECTVNGVMTYYCTHCDASYTEAIESTGHKFDEGKITKNATCTTAGERTFTCSGCGKTFTEEIAPLTHDWGEGKVTAQATCETAGERTYTCTRCGETRTEEIPALGHSWIADGTPTQAPTCTATGRGKVKCSVCGATEEDGVIPALGHNWDEGYITDQPTCTKDGVRTYTCLTCGETRTESVAALGHSFAEGKLTKAPTCENSGVMTYTCTHCGTTKTESVPALGHSWNDGRITTPATCEEAGVMTYTCTRCGETKTEAIPAKGHTFVAVGKPTQAPTCTANGRGKVKCSDCGYEVEDGVIPALGHEWNDGVITKQPSCTAGGVKTYYCTRCDATRTEEIAPNGHVWSEGKVTKEATCTQTGLKVYSCLFCGETRTEELPASGHEWDEGKITAPATCTESGVKTYTCTVCGDIKTETLPAIGHKWVADGTPDQAPTCTTTGRGNVKCENCEETRQNAVIPASGHEWGEGEITTPATCTSDGVKTYTCAHCEETYTETIPALGHKWNDGEVVNSATCETAGQMQFGCLNDGCEESYLEEIPALGHSWNEGEITTEATCTESGLKTYTCTVCGETKTEIIPATGHKWIADGEPTLAPTCTTAGTGKVKCEYCGVTLEEGIIPALGHDFDEGTQTKAPTCLESGVITHKCSRCAATYEESVPAKGHTWVADGDPDQAPTCTEDGRGKVKCSECGAEAEDGVIPALGHDWDDGVITKQPTATEAGERTYTCRRCGETRTEEIPPLGETEPSEPDKKEEPLEVGGMVVAVGAESVVLLGLVAALAIVSKRRH